MSMPVPHGAPLRGAIDLSSLVAKPASAPPRGDLLDVTESSLQEIALKSRDVPVLVAFVSAASPASAQLARDISTLAPEYEHAFVAAACNVDAEPAIAQAFQVASVPALMVILGGRPAPLFQGGATVEQLRDVIDQVLDVARSSGIGAAPKSDDAVPADDVDEPLPPLHQEAFDAIERGDLAGAEEAYDRALKENPKDADARAGRAQVRLMGRTEKVDLAAARAVAAAAADDIEAQFTAADLDVLGGHLEDAFARLIDLVRITPSPERDAVRARLVELFDVVGPEDQRVTDARRALASALF